MSYSSTCLGCITPTTNHDHAGVLAWPSKGRGSIHLPQVEAPESTTGFNRSHSGSCLAEYRNANPMPGVRNVIISPLSAAFHFVSFQPPANNRSNHTVVFPRCEEAKFSQSLPHTQLSASSIA